MLGPLRKVAASGFARSVAVLLSGATLAHAMTALAAPVLSRLYDPADFGLLALFATIVSVLAEGASWRYELTVVLPKRDDDSANVLVLAGCIVVLTTFLSLIGVALAGDWLARQLGSPEIAPFLWWVPLALLSIGLYRVFSYWVTRRKQFRPLSISQVIRSLGAALTQIAIGLLRAGPAGLVGGRVAGEAAAMVGLGTLVWRTDRSLILRALSLSRMKQLAREYSDFPKFSLPQGLIDSLSQSTAVFLLVYFFDAEVVGFYAMAHRLLYLPSRFIGQSVRQVFLQRASQARAMGADIFGLHWRTTLGLAAVGIVPALVMVLFGRPIFSLVLGSEWASAGRYAQWMTLWLFFAFINPPSTVLTQVLRKQRFHLVMSIGLLACRAAALAIGGSRFSALTAIALFCCVSAVFNAILISYMLAFSRRRSAPETSLT